MGGLKILFTGPPRGGKSQVIRQLAEAFPGNAGGFAVVEQKDADGRRCGFDLQVVWRGPGQPLTVVDRAVLAHTDRWDFPLQVGRYRVDPAALHLAVTALDAAMHEHGLVVLDEIGPLQICSPEFRDAVLRCLTTPGPMLGAISNAEDPFLEQVRAHPLIKLLEVNRQNRHHLADGLRRWLCSS